MWQVTVLLAAVEAAVTQTASFLLQFVDCSSPVDKHGNHVNPNKPGGNYIPIYSNFQVEII